MATIPHDIREKLGVALNEATLIDLKFDSLRAIAKCTLRVVTVDKEGKVPEDTIVLLTFAPVGRLIASLRHGNWDESDAKVEKFGPDQVSATVRSFNGQSIYGWEFVNLGDKYIEDWVDKLSLDYKSDNIEGFTNTIDLFQEEGITRHLDLRIWFDHLSIEDSAGNQIDVETFFENGKRAWDSIFSGKDKTS
jgi:hypothetical protein